MEKSKLLLPAFDAQLMDLKILPKCCHTTVRYTLKLYDEILRQEVTKLVCFEDVVAIEFLVNYFDAPNGAEVRGFYELFQRDQKEAMIERNFLSRRERILFHGDYDYDPLEANDLLNNREDMACILRELDDYHLLEQQTTGGTYLLLAKGWTVK